ncbi:serine hydrolase domain-containing protein [Neorhodopirellula pilleata]|uniref:Penicillin-binding protein 4 n=1 Tax=Neorhodopirellula pilleata TaxID=2714738 RepID=A0A5C6A6J1_9BACT|nr:Penicillin-binding protein 4* [Neorhodopirellula pilleata]
MNIGRLTGFALARTFAVIFLTTLSSSDKLYSQELEPPRVLLEAAIAEGEMAGAVVMMAHRGETVYAVAVGDAQVQPTRRSMQLDTVFDLASLTKPIGTATSIMVLVDQGRVDVNTSVSNYWPAFGSAGKDAITIADLLLHRGGLIADNALSDYTDDQQENWKRISALRPIAPPGERFVYSDVGFIVLGKVVEEVSGLPLNVFARQHIFEPLGMTETGYLPTDALKLRCAASEQRDAEWLVGEVHDPRAARLDGVAGHAGLFSTASDLIRFGNALATITANSPSNDLFSVATRNQMIAPHDVPRGERAFGWDIRSPYSSNRPTQFSSTAFGHGGFTGTVLWIDPEQELVFVFLSNRLHPDGQGNVNRLAAKVADAIIDEMKILQPILECHKISIPAKKFSKMSLNANPIATDPSPKTVSALEGVIPGNATTSAADDRSTTESTSTLRSSNQPDA